MVKKPLIKMPSIDIMKMPRIQKEMLACLQCGYCIEGCEAHAQTPWESVTPRGKIYYLTQLDKKNAMDKLLNRNVTVSEDFVDAIYKCTGCGTCEVVCHAGLELVSFWERVRAWLVDYGVGPLPAHKKLAERISEGRNPYGESPEKRDAWWPANVKREPIPDVVMFAGCTGSYRMQYIPKAGVEVLDRAGVKQNCLGADEYCCTSPALRTGVLTKTKEAAETVVNKADAIGAKDMVMTCSGCFKTVSSDFGNHYSKTGQNVYHFTQYVDNLLTKRKLTINHPLNAKVAYHDPCHLGRHSGVFDEPRNILKKIKGVQLVEMERTKMNSRCCGAGGGYKSAFNDFAVNVAVERIRDAEAVGAEILATACPFCVLNLAQGAKKIGSKVKVMDISEILLKVTEPPASAPAPAPAPAPPKAEPAPAPAPAAPAPPKTEPVPAPAVPKAEPASNEAQKKEHLSKPEPEPVKAVVAEPVKAVVPMPMPTVDPIKKIEPIPVEEDSYDDVFGEEKEDDPAELKLRRRLWRGGYRYRKSYGKEKATIAFIRARVAVFVGPEARDKETDDRLKKEGWTVIRFKESNITDAKKESAKVIDAIENNLNAMMNDDDPKGRVRPDADLFADESDDDPAELKLRRNLWRNDYRYRRKYGREKITVAFRKAKVGAFVSADVYKRKSDDQLVKRGWTIMRFKESDITDAKKESVKVMIAVDRNLELLSKGTIPEGANLTGSDVPDPSEEENTPEHRLRMTLWKTNRYRRNFGKENIPIAYPGPKVAVFVADDAAPMPVDGKLEKDGWTVLRFKGANITDGAKESEKVIAAIGKSKDAAAPAASDKDDDLSYLEEADTPALRIRKAVWAKRLRYRRDYGRAKIDLAFVKWKVAVFVDADGKLRTSDDALVNKGWIVLRFKESAVTDGKTEAEKISAAIKDNKRILSRPKKKAPAKKA
ncbi:MAG: 4Fe-4S dicluster domain-containing protein [Methanomassiliicoccaceae archaeon]|jgi:Fe-S oxidoreductase/very-short-patch-repair endonuclease|nr:4Fe-4S dicluster domain-containing protein [Methanomassiliicoccaceae archaeon]